MRVVAGSARGRKLDAPPGRNTRPTSDRVREAVFNALGSMDAIDGARVLDLFAGSGAMGIEALSRGAANATFVESDRGAASVLAANVERCGFSGRTRVVTTTVERHLPKTGTDAFDLVIADPPYAYDRWEELFDALGAATIVVESDRAVPIPASWIVVRDRGYGSTVVQIAIPATSAPAANPQEQQQ